MKVLFIPFYHENPYQKNLADALKCIGVNVISVNYTPGHLFPILKTAITNWKPDIIHLHWTDRLLLAKSRPLNILKSLRFIFELCLIKFLGIKLVWTVHNLFNHEEKAPILEKYFHRFLCLYFYNQIIVMSASGVKSIIKAYRLPNTIKIKINIVPHGHYINNYRNIITKNQAREKLSISENSTVFLFFGIIRPYKGVLSLAEDFSKIISPDKLLIIAGKPSTKFLENMLMEYSRRYNQIKTYLHFIPDNEIEIYMNAADAVVLPFQDILNSGSTILAMSFAKAVIAPNIGCIPELIDKGGGFLYNPNRKSNLANAINEAQTSDLLSMGLHNYNKVITYTWEDIARRTKSVYFQCYEDN